MDSWESRNDHLDAFTAALAQSPDTTLLAFDFDGTLSPMVPDPAQAYVHSGAREALAALTKRCHVAIITGRPVDQVAELGHLDDDILEHLIVLGQYGSERLDRNGRTVPEPPEAVRHAMEDLRPLADAHPGLFLEDKQQAIGVHTRRAEPGTFESIRPAVEQIAEKHGLDVEPGKEVLELRSHKVSKGDALSDLIKELGAVAVGMVGDDLGDLPAFELVAERQAAGLPGLVVVSSSDERPELLERADVLCNCPAGVADWMETLLR